jgi:hypothetical protein
LSDFIAIRFVALHLILDLVARVHHRGVILLAEVTRDLRQ